MIKTIFELVKIKFWIKLNKCYFQITYEESDTFSMHNYLLLSIKNNVSDIKFQFHYGLGYCQLVHVLIK